MKKLVFLIAVLAVGIQTTGAHPEEDLCTSTFSKADSLQTEPQKGWLAEWWKNLTKGNVDRTFEKPVDVSFGVSPYYSQESGVGLGAQVSALYRLDRTDSIMQPSDFSLMGGGSTNGTYSIGIQGNNHFSRDKRLSYILEFRHQNREFWGINFNECSQNEACRVHYSKINVVADYQQRFSGDWFWGAALRLKYAAANPDKPEYLLGQSKSGFYGGLGLSIMYDSRDYILNAKQGMFFMLRHVYYPYVFGSGDYDVSCTTLQFNAYHKLWEGAVMAYDVFAETSLSNAEVPWPLRQEICYDDKRMRGYYSGGYMDDNQVCVQAELRQHIYKRLGAVVWGGYGTLFDKLSDIDSKHLLPNYGFGVRFEMKKNTNIRMDFGFGRNEGSVIFNFGEAF